MTTKRFLYAVAIAGVGLAVFVIASRPGLSAGQAAGAAVRIDPDDIGGVVTSTKGPEAGVWVIAETTDLPTKMNKTVVTDDQGRYLIPDLPKANYVVWARGYGLTDSAKTTSEPGKTVNITDPYNDPRFNKEVDRRTGQPFRVRLSSTFSTRNLAYTKD